MKVYSIVLLVAVAVLASCATVTPIANDLPTPPQQSVHRGFSLLPLDETGWQIGASDRDRLVLGRRGDNLDETFAIIGFTVVLPEFESRDQFMGFAKNVTPETDSVRFKLLSEHAKETTINEQTCVQIKGLMEDHGAKKWGTNRPDFMIIETYELVCPHPQETVAIVVGYSHRYYPGHADSQSEDKAGRIFETVEFISF